MSKKITSFLVLLAVMLLTLPSHAQVQKAKRTSSDAKGVMEMRQMPKGQKFDRAELAQQKNLVLAKVAKEAEAAGTTIDQWDWAAHAPKQFVPQNRIAPPTALKEQKQHVRANLKNRKAQSSGVNAPRRAATDELVTLPAGVEPEVYTLTLIGWNGNETFGYEKSKMVAFDGDDIYVQGLAYWFEDAYVKGTRNADGQYVFESGQFVGEDEYGAEYLVGCEVVDDELVYAPNFVFDFDETTRKLSLVGYYGESEEPDEAALFNYYDIAVYELSETPKVIELPEGANVETWYADGSSFAGLPSTAKVAFVDNNVYVSGIFARMPDSWVMGTLEGNTVTFPTEQYVGSLYDIFDVWTFACDLDEDKGTYIRKDAVTFTYDAEAKTLTLDANNTLALTTEKYSLSYVDYITDLTLSANEPVIELATVPFYADFAKQSDFKRFSIIDNNDDGKTWSWDSYYYANYTYSLANIADDYLVLPIELEANKNYIVTVSAAAYMSSYPEKFEVKVGKAATAADMNITAIDATTLTNNTFEDYEGTFITDEAGTWYVAIHAISDPDKMRLSVRSMSIELGADPTAPVAPTLTVEPGAEGALSVTGTVTAPTKAINGNNLEGKLEKIDILCDDAVLTSLYDITPGTTENFSDQTQTRGFHTYQTVAYNASGMGEKSEKITIWVGPDTPADIENVQLTGMGENSITMTWDPVKGQNGGYIDLAAVQYTVTTIDMMEIWGMPFPFEGEPIGSVTGETTATVDYPIDEGEARFDYFGVKAKVNGDESNPTSWMAYALAGAPYELPIEESFTGGRMHYLWDYNENSYLGVSPDDSDGDGVALELTAAYEDGPVIFESFKLDLKSAANAKMLFDAKKGSSATDKITVYAIAADGTTTDLETFTLTDEYQTFKVAVPDEIKKDRWVRLGLKANVEIARNILIDNIKILDLYQHDLSIAVSAPKSVKAGETATITATVKNVGESAASGYNVTITAGDETLLNVDVNDELLPFATNNITAELTPSIFADNSDLDIVATVTYVSDQKEENNTAITQISVKESLVPGATNVTAQPNDDCVIVYWTAPIDVVVTEEVTEDFEEGTGGWTFIDADGDGHNWYYQLGDEDGILKVHGGEGAVASASYDNDTYRALKPDNWLVSPNAVLDGTFKFWAVAQSEDYCYEHFQVYVSTTSATDVSTFEPVSEEFVTTGEYKEYTVDLSSYAGQTGWIAIRHFNSTDQFLLVVDDITYITGGALEIDHFNIYLDGESVATAAADAVTATLEDVADGDHTVAVSVVYTNGQESKPVETTVHVSAATGIQNITVVTKPVDVYSVEGKLVRQQTTSLSGLKGVYILDGKKVVIK